MDEASLSECLEPPGNERVSLLHLVGQRFEGETSVEQLDGEGEARFEGGHVYKGTFSRGFMDRFGVFTHAAGLKYEGEFVSNLPRGRGTFTWPDGSCYEGDVWNGMRHGCGSYRCGQSGVFYCGQWRSGRRHGKGSVYYDQERSSWYKGDWLNNKREGRGERRYPSGNTYCGEWRNNLPHGAGTMTWQNVGQQYVGNWQDGLHYGRGSHVWVLGALGGSHYSQNNQYVGDFMEGRRHGAGVFLYAGGAKYEGQWKDNKKHGQGKLTFEDGNVYEGEFVDDRMLTPDGLMTDSTPLGSDSDVTLNVEGLLDGFPEKMRGDERRQVEFVVLRQISELRSVYSFYSRLGNSRYPDNTVPLSRLQLWRLLKDCNLHRHGFTLTQINQFMTGAASSEDHRSPFTTLLFHQLLNCLLIVAYRIYSPDVPSQKNLLAACLSRLLREDVLPHATTVKGFLFQQTGVAAAALQHVEKSWEVFRAHCRMDGNMTYRELLWMFQDLRLLDKRLTPARLVEILTAESCDPTNPTSCLNLEMNFLEFFEVLLGCAEVKCLNEDTPGPGSEAQTKTTNNRTQQTEGSPGQRSDGSSGQRESQVSETQQSAGKPEADGGTNSRLENKDHLERRIQTVNQFFNNVFFPACERHQKLSKTLKVDQNQ